jgi:hypothetical protein
MKPSILILVLAGLLAGGPASFGQAPASTSTSHQRFNLNGVWQSHTPDGQLFTYRFEQQGNQFRAIFGGAIPQSNDFLGFEGQYQGDAIAGRRLTRIAWKGQPAQWTEQTLFVDDPDHVHFRGSLEIVRMSPAQQMAQQRQVAPANGNNQAAASENEAKVLAALAALFFGSALSPDPQPNLENLDRSTINDEKTCEQAGGKWGAHWVFPPSYSDDQTPTNVFECQ